jgi:hypothetical protein
MKSCKEFSRFANIVIGHTTHRKEKRIFKDFVNPPIKRIVLKERKKEPLERGFSLRLIIPIHR